MMDINLMSEYKDIKKLSQGFSKLSREERWQRLQQMGLLTFEEICYLRKRDSFDLELAEQFVENVVSCYQLPLGVAVNFIIDNVEHVIPMAVEETSIIAAASKTAKWIQEHGVINTENLGHLSIGQILIPKVKNFSQFKEIIEQNKQTLIFLANQHVATGLVQRGGGVEDIKIRRIARGDNYDMMVLHILVNTCDAMGANIINQICEYLRTPIEAIINEKVSLCILSNLADTKLTRAKIIIKDIEPKLGEAIAEASLFAWLDPYRAATSNKGVLNGIDGVVLATGNDWRAVEAGIHAYAARDGQYRSITRWQVEGSHLVGMLEAPIIVGTVGGVTRLHPTARLCLKMLRVTDANHLARVVAAVGLVQNLGALKALCTDGISRGHMKLHINNLALAAGATDQEFKILKTKLYDHLLMYNRVTQNDANYLLAELRKENNFSSDCNNGN